jgi:hypothetical protein
MDRVLGELIMLAIAVPLYGIAASLKKIADAAKDGVLQMRDVDRAKVYSEHLGQKLRPEGK